MAEENYNGLWMIRTSGCNDKYQEPEEKFRLLNFFKKFVNCYRHLIKTMILLTLLLKINNVNNMYTC